MSSCSTDCFLDSYHHSVIHRSLAFVSTVSPYSHGLFVCSFVRFFFSTTVSYEEFKVFFRKNTSKVALEAAQLGRESTFGDSEAELVGLDAFIPGGKYDNPDEKAT